MCRSSPVKPKPRTAEEIAATATLSTADFAVGVGHGRSARRQNKVIGMTGASTKLRELVNDTVHKLDRAILVDEVETLTPLTHLITGGSNTPRTLKVLFAIARGSWVMREEWVGACAVAEKWLPEEKYVSAQFPGAKIARDSIAAGSTSACLFPRLRVIQCLITNAFGCDLQQIQPCYRVSRFSLLKAW